MHFFLMRHSGGISECKLLDKAKYKKESISSASTSIISPEGSRQKQTCKHNQTDIHNPAE